MEDSSRAYYRGETYSYSFRAPEGWLLNLDNAYSEGYTAAMYPQGQDYPDAKTIVYVWIFRTSGKSLAEFISADSAHYVRKDSLDFLRTDTLKIKGGDAAIILEADDPGGASKLAAIGYIDAVTEFVVYELHITDRVYFAEAYGKFREALRWFSFATPQDN